MRLSRAFTLVEMLITLAILAILAGVVIPALNNFVVNQRIQTQASALQSSLQLARSEAASKNQVIKVIPAANTSTGWSSGWCIVTSNVNDCSGSVIRRYPPIGNGVVISGNYLQTGTFISFRRDGSRSPAVSGGLKVSSPSLDANAQRARCLALDAIGRVSISSIKPGDNC